MKPFLKRLLWGLAIVAILVAAGISIERSRQRSLRSWAVEVGGQFEPGAFLDGAPLPEAAAFDAGAEPDSVHYHNIVRYERNGADYTVAQYSRTFRDIKGTIQTLHHVVCFVRIPGADWPPLNVGFPRGALGRTVREVVGLPGAPEALPIPVRVEGFRERYEARPLGSERSVPVERTSVLLSEAVQKEMVAQSALLAGFQAKGPVIRLQAVEWQSGYPHRELAAVAERLAAAWRP